MLFSEIAVNSPTKSIKDDLSSYLQSSSDALDSLLRVPDLNRVGSIQTEVLEEMMKINREFDIKEFNREDIDELLNVDNFFTNSDYSLGHENNES